MTQRFQHFACIDWSGAAGAFQPGIAIAVCEPYGAPTLIEPPGRHWSREEALRWLRHQDDMLIGIDFSASLPFVDEGDYFPGWDGSPTDAHALWATIERMAAHEPHLGAAQLVDEPELSRHFRRPGGRTGDRFGQGIGRMRMTERVAQEAGFAPSSSFNLVGAAQVGKASLAGMRLLHRLSGHIPIWPFDPMPESGSLIVEVYTSIAARAAGVARGKSKIRTPEALDAALAMLGSPAHAALDRYDDHRTDAMLGAAWLRTVAYEERLWAPTLLSPTIAATEGWTFGLH